MGFTEDNETDLKSASFELLGKNDEVLLSATYISSGILETVRERRYKGQLDINGVFAVDGGTLFDQGLVSNQIFLQVAFDYVWQNEYKDLKTRKGTYTIFDSIGGGTPPNPPEPPTEVPEPMSLSLLAVGLLGMAAKKAKH